MNNRVVTFHILLAAQFALVAANIIMNIKIGLFFHDTYLVVNDYLPDTA